ncbi:MAG: undecaprenyl/decaprenyl-phosphate alpha-N-acetylglucosaminyl 1-phosphate transferase [Chloroflexi bacterium]|nr:undecaprenyl/decaprenyl-phosphate alpha-N-acetylglucosaminyl 1-phosphate transferase [Chloroflexota bacterium]
MLLLWIGGVAALATLTSFLLVGMVIRHGRAFGMLDLPRPGEVQVRAVPRNGGYAMLGAVWLAVTLAVFGRPPEVHAPPGDDWKLVGVLIGSLLIVPLALVDDRKRLGPAAQFLGQGVIATIPVAFGLRMGSIASPFGAAIELPFWLDIPLTILWILGMINAINLIDVMDGLAAGIVTMAALVLFTRSLWFGQYTVAVLPLALAGAAIGYLPHNFHPARIFMGTSGSVFLGYWLATMSVIGGAKVGTAFVVLGVPILDTAWVIGRRVLARRSPFHGGDGGHLPQRIHALGLSQVRTVLLLYLICALFGFLTLSLHSPVAGPYLVPTMAKLWLMIGVVAVMAAVLVTVSVLSVRQRRRRAEPGHVHGPDAAERSSTSY